MTEKQEEIERIATIEYLNAHEKVLEVYKQEQKDRIKKETIRAMTLLTFWTLLVLIVWYCVIREEANMGAVALMCVFTGMSLCSNLSIVYNAHLRQKIVNEIDEIE